MASSNTLTSTITTHQELLTYIKLHPTTFNKINYRFQVSDKLFDYYASIMPDSDNDCIITECPETTHDDDIMKWMEQNRIVLKWTVDKHTDPVKIIKQLSINTPVSL
jgi:hypothetical protein